MIKALIKQISKKSHEERKRIISSTEGESIAKKAKIKGTQRKVETNDDEDNNVNASQPTEKFDMNRLQVLKYCIDREKFTAERNLFLKGDASNESKLVIANIPSHISASSVINICEKVLSVKVMDTNARPNFKNKSSLEGYYWISLKLHSQRDVIDALSRCCSIDQFYLSDLGITREITGIPKWKNDYCNRHIPEEDLNSEIDSFFHDYDEKKAEEKVLARKMRNIPDSDGWITVRRTQHKSAPDPVVVKHFDGLSKIAKNEKATKESDMAFYRFQMKESKLKRADELKRMFEEDKKKLAMAKAARKFRPE